MSAKNPNLGGDEGVSIYDGHASIDDLLQRRRSALVALQQKKSPEGYTRLVGETVGTLQAMLSQAIDLLEGIQGIEVETKNLDHERYRAVKDAQRRVDGHILEITNAIRRMEFPNPYVPSLDIVDAVRERIIAEHLPIQTSDLHEVISAKFDEILAGIARNTPPNFRVMEGGKIHPEILAFLSRDPSCKDRELFQMIADDVYASTEREPLKRPWGTLRQDGEGNLILEPIVVE